MLPNKNGCLMSRFLCLDEPHVLCIEQTVLDARPGAVLVESTPFFAGGGGQLADRGTLSWAGGSSPIRSVTPGEGGVWHHFEGAEELDGIVRLEVDQGFRAMMCELHTLAHVLNALVHTRFGGALLTGAQLSADSTFRVDFDLPAVENNQLRALEDDLNEVIRQDLPVRTSYMQYEEARKVAGLFRSKSVAPPPSKDGTVRIVEIVGLDRQACGGTHLVSTGRARAARILKVDNKGRQNRRVRVQVGRT
jgi:misacylated tRNA(Ala) deacylase